MEDKVFIQGMSFDNENRQSEILSVDYAILQFDPDPNIPPKIIVTLQFLLYDPSAESERTEILSSVLELKNNIFYPVAVNSHQLFFASIINKAINLEKVICIIKTKLVEAIQ